MIIRVLVALALVLLPVSCSNPEAEQAEQRQRIAQRGAELGAALAQFNSRAAGETTGLLVQLAFGAEADLDLYVTDPLLETVYFANHKSKSGGRISDDARCGVTGLRIEEVRFDKPMAGRYRVGVDFPQRCDNAAERAAFFVSVRNNETHEQVQGEVALQQFEVVVLEFDIE